MPRPLKFLANKISAQRINRSTIVATGLVLWLCSAAHSQQDTEKKRYQKPIAGPVFAGPIVSPGQELPSSDIESDSKRPIDLAFGAYQRGYFLTALELALPRADSGDPAAQTLIAELFWNGLGVGRDRSKAADWYKFAADAGGADAQFSYANILLQGKFVKEDKEQGEAYMRKAADSGHRRAQFNVAQFITARRPTWASFKEALPLYQSAAEAGIPDAQYALANIYAEAKGVAFGDDNKARGWLEKAARGGLGAAQVDLGIWLANGRGGAKDVVQARQWFVRAAVQRNRVAQNRLARIYAYGSGVKADPILGSAWHIVSRRAGFSDTELDRFFQSLEEIDRKRALEAANQLSRRLDIAN